jgi:hypothetical protein
MFISVYQLGLSILKQTPTIGRQSRIHKVNINTSHNHSFSIAASFTPSHQIHPLYHVDEEHSHITCTGIYTLPAKSSPAASFTHKSPTFTQSSLVSLHRILTHHSLQSIAFFLYNTAIFHTLIRTL